MKIIVETRQCLVSTFTMQDFISKDKNKLSLDTRYTSFYIDDIDINQTDDKEEKDFIGVAVSYKKITALMVFFILGFLMLLSRIFYLQVIKGEYFNSIAEGNRIRIKSIKPRRGIIYDRNNKQLVANIPSFSLKILQSDLPKDENEKDRLIGEIAEFIDEDKNNILKILKDKEAYYYQPIIIKENIAYEKAMLLYLESIDMPGIILEEVSKRQYVSNSKLNSISHILGYNGKISEAELKKYEVLEEYLLDDYIGKTGVELSFEKILRGELGKSQIETNALGKKIRVIAKRDAVPGADLILSIDIEMQNFIENLLKEELKELEKRKASVVIMDPRNGEIISLVSFPSFDNNLFVSGISKEDYENLIKNKDNPLFNRSISGSYPPGSTFKLVMAGVGLEKGIIKEHTRIKSTGGIWIGQWFFPDWASGGHGLVNVKGAIANSVNTFFYYVGGGYKNFKGLGIDAMANEVKAFNLGAKTNIDLPMENSGFIPNAIWKEEKINEPWYIGDTYHFSIGQGYVLTTPLQVALYTSFYANGGILYKPKIVKNLIYSGNDGKEIKNEYLQKNIISKKNVQIVKEGMRGTVTYGSARSLSNLPFAVAGKTGTAQISNNKEPHAWFTSFAPYENPEIVLTVLIEEGGEGSKVAVPIARKILEFWRAN